MERTAPSQKHAHVHGQPQGDATCPPRSQQGAANVDYSQGERSGQAGDVSRLGKSVEMQHDVMTGTRRRKQDSRDFASLTRRDLAGRGVGIQMSGPQKAVFPSEY